MATLTGSQIKHTYDSLLKLEDNDGLTGTKKKVTDGLGNETPLSMSDTEVTSSVDVEATGFKTPTGTATQMFLADGTVQNVSEIEDKHYEHNQTSASALWNISHNLGKFPSATVVDSGGSVVIGEVEHVTNNTMRISFLGSFSGKAYLN
jgi:hypothetical protein